jgi:hypothetical protein
MKSYWQLYKTNSKEERKAKQGGLVYLYMIIILEKLVRLNVESMWDVINLILFRTRATRPTL